MLAHAPDLPAIGSASGEAGGPKPSHRLRFNYSDGSLQVAASPCRVMALPDIIPAILA